MGAHVSGLLIGLFGLGAFWIPILLLLASIHFFGNHPNRAMIATIVGGVILVVITGSLLSVQQNQFLLFGNKFSAGGIVGIPFKAFLVKYTNTTGSVIILVLLWIIGFILATGFSLIAFGKRFLKWTNVVNDRFNTFYLKRKERKEKAKKRSEVDPEKIAKRAKKIKIKQSAPKPIKSLPPPKQEVFDFMRSGKGYQAPPFNVLEDAEDPPASSDGENLRMQSQLLEKKLEDFGVHGKVVAVSPGPVITTYEYEPAPGVKINKIVNLSDDLALALRAISIRIVAPIPGKAVVVVY